MSSITCFPWLDSDPDLQTTCICSADDVVSSTSAKLFHRHLYADSAWISAGPEGLRELSRAASRAAIALRDHSGECDLSPAEMLARSKLINIVAGHKFTMPDVNPAIISEVARMVSETIILSEQR